MHQKELHAPLKHYSIVQKHKKFENYNNFYLNLRVFFVVGNDNNNKLTVENCG